LPDLSIEKPIRDDITRFKYRPIGQILLESSVISMQQLEIALGKHWSTGQKIGQSIIDLGMASSGDIARALELQLNVPHFDIRNFDKNGGLKDFINRIPMDLMKQSHAVPVNKDKNVLSLAMVNPKDIAAIDKIRSVTGCNVAPFFVLENEFEDIWGRITNRLEQMYKKDR
ncbi:MAG: hypothetical protein KKB52_03415, partial [Candidatus Omnitrophica bacterium]|nr:hypothetical protein [Candidatus Omnitrophota bacterium]